MSTARMLMARGRSAQPAPYRGDKFTPALTGGVSAARRIVVALNADVLDQPHAPNDPDRALSALRSIPADLERPEWLPVVFAARSAGVRVADFLTWCRTGGNKPPLSG